MTRSQLLYVEFAAAAFSAMDAATRAHAWNGLAIDFQRAYRAAHPMTSTEHAQAAYRTLAKAIRQRMRERD